MEVSYIILLKAFAVGWRTSPSEVGPYWHISSLNWKHSVIQPCSWHQLFGWIIQQLRPLLHSFFCLPRFPLSFYSREIFKGPVQSPQSYIFFLFCFLTLQYLQTCASLSICCLIVSYCLFEMHAVSHLLQFPWPFFLPTLPFQISLASSICLIFSLLPFFIF